MMTSDDLKAHSKVSDLETLRENIGLKITQMRNISQEIMTAFNQLDDQSKIGAFRLDKEYDISLEQIADQMQKVDSFLWNLVLNESGIFNITSQNLKDQLKEKFDYYTIVEKRKRYHRGEEWDKSVPTFSEEAVNKVISDITKNLPSVRTASLVEVFKKLNTAAYYRTRNDAERQSTKKIEKKMRFNYFRDITKDKWPSTYDWASDRWGHSNPRLFGDLENALRMVDAKSNLELKDRICTKMMDIFYKAEYSKTHFPMSFENEYFKLLIYKKGTVLLSFKEEKLDVLAQFNKLTNDGSKLA